MDGLVSVLQEILICETGQLLDIIRLSDLCRTCQVFVVSFQLSCPGWNISVSAINWSNYACIIRSIIGREKHQA